VWSVRFTQAARAELIEAHDWYEKEAPGLGRRFRAEIDKVVEGIADNPERYALVYKSLRRARLKKFPYALFFGVPAASLRKFTLAYCTQDQPLSSAFPFQ
jgi:plasmid stabilization system protein ParE